MGIPTGATIMGHPFEDSPGGKKRRLSDPHHKGKRQPVKSAVTLPHINQERCQLGVACKKQECGGMPAHETWRL